MWKETQEREITRLPVVALTDMQVMNVPQSRNYNPTRNVFYIFLSRPLCAL